MSRVPHTRDRPVQVDGYVVDKVLLLLFCQPCPKFPGLDEVGVGDDALEVDRASQPLFVGSTIFVLRCLDDRRPVDAGYVVGQVAVVCDGGGPVAFRGIVAVEGPVCRQLRKVDPQTVALRVAVGKQPDMKHCVITSD